MTNIPPHGSALRSALPVLLLALLVILAIIVAIVIVVVRVVQPVEVAIPQIGPSVNTAAVPSDPSHFDPIAAYDAVHQFAGADLDLAYINIDYARSDGTLDLNANYDPRVEYEFFRELSTPPPNAPPVGSKGVTDQKWDDQADILIQPSRMLSVGGNVQGLKKIPAPKCSLKRLWDTAIEKGASKDAVAIVRLDASGYSFRIEGTKIDLSFDTDCGLIQSG
jgi:hypothetical protein